MTRREIENIQNKIDSLPKGAIYIKKINGRQYEYWQYRENGKTVSRRIKNEEKDTELREKLSERRSLEKILHEEGIPVKRNPAKAGRLQKPGGLHSEAPDRGGWNCIVRTGDELLRAADSAAHYQPREIFKKLSEYIYAPADGRVLILCGLRLTGKTTMIRQMIREMPAGDLAKTAFIQAAAGNTMSQVTHDLDRLEKQGCRYVFINEITSVDDFMSGAAILSDVYAAAGMKIILSGNDSLKFIFAVKDQLFGRAVMLHTTFIPFSDFEAASGGKGIDDYIRLGGVMNAADSNPSAVFDDKARAAVWDIFSSGKDTEQYIDSAIVNNTKHSLEGKCDPAAEELPHVIKSVIREINQQFTMSVITDTFEATAPLTYAGSLRYYSEIKKYLKLLDVIDTVYAVSDTDPGHRSERIVFTQPGLRFAQVSEYVSEILEHGAYSFLDINERAELKNRLMDAVRSRMLKDIVLLETKRARPGRDVFTITFDASESSGNHDKYDVVVSDPDRLTCEIFAVSNSDKLDDMAVRELDDVAKCARVRRMYGDITGKYLLYRGEDAMQGDVQLLNVERYLTGL